MEQAELEEWFQQRKEKLEKEFFEKLMQGKKTTQAHDRFERAYQQLIKEYQKRDAQIFQQQQRRKQLQKPIVRWQEFLHRLKPHPDRWYRHRKKAFEKFLLDWKIRRITGKVRKI